MSEQAQPGVGWLVSETGSAFGWLASLYRKIFKIVPLAASLSVILRLVSLGAMILAYFLPLKVLILVGSESVPWYVRDLFGDLDREFLVVALTFAALGFYLLHLLADNLGESTIERGAEQLLDRASKIAIFENQDRLAEVFFKRLSQILSGCLFAVIALVLSGVLVPWTLVVFLGVLVLSWLVSAVVCANPEGRNWLQYRFKEYLNVLAGVAFLSAFAALVTQFYSGQMSNVAYGIIVLILMRQASQRLAQGCVEYVNLAKQQAKVNSLFFFSNPFDAASAEGGEPYFDLTAPQRRDEWMREAIAALARSDLVSLRSSWRESGTKNVQIFDAAVTFSDPAMDSQQYLIKLFGKGRNAAAQHEAALLGDKWTRSLPAPRLIGATSVEGFEVLAFRKPAGGVVKKKRLKEVRSDIVARCWAVEPPDEVIDQYRRSRPLLYERLKPTFMARVRHAANTKEELALVAAFEAKQDLLIRTLRELPLFVYTQDLSQTSLFASGDRLAAINWARWSVEPVGVGLRGESDAEATKMLEDAAARRASLRGVGLESLRLVTLVHQLEADHRRQRYRSVIRLAGKVASLI